MKKIGLVTFYKDNFGSILQCYATKKTIEDSGFNCIILSEIENEIIVNDNILHKIKRFIYLLSNFISNPQFFSRWRNSKRNLYPLSNKSKEMMDKFVLETLRPEYYSMEDLNKNESEFKFFIAGSDQIWNVYNKTSKIYFLNFAPKNKRVGFAVSFGVEKANRTFIKTIKNEVKEFQRISVRELNGIDILEKSNYKNVQRVGDPTLLLSANDWRNFSSKSNIKIDSYVLIHFLNEPSKYAISFIKKYFKNQKIISIAYSYKIFNVLGWEFIDCGPEDYIAYIDKAKIIITDSYHTSLFSIIFQKEFYTFERQYLHGHPQSNRIRDLLKRFNLDYRFLVNGRYDFNKKLDIKLDALNTEKRITMDFLEEVINSEYE